MRRVEAATWYANIWMAGDYAHAVQSCRAFCIDVGLCVTVTPTTYVYTGGSETGVCVRLINYPRFPKVPDELEATAKQLAAHLCCALCQQSYSIEFPEITLWVSLRPEDNK